MVQPVQKPTQQPPTKSLLTVRREAYQKIARKIIIKALNYAKEISKPPS